MAKHSIIRRPSARLSAGCAAVALAAGFSMAHAASISDLNASANFNFSNPTIQNSFTLDGLNQLNGASSYVRVGNGAEDSIASLGVPTLSTYDGTRGIVAQYTAGSYTLQVDYHLTGQSAGSGAALLTETVRIMNTSASSLDFHFFSYSDFDLNSTAGNDSVQLVSFGGSYFLASQVDGVSAWAQTVFTPGASRAEADITGALLAKLNNGVADNLNNTASAGPGDVAWALQWDLTIAPGLIAAISKTTSIQLQVIPEPSAFAFVGLGLAGLLLARRK
jgi:hypothetical protein